MSFPIRSMSVASISAVVLAVAAAGCQMTPAKSAPPVVLGKQDTAMLTIAGSMAKMKAFDTRLRQLLSVGPQDSDTLGCRNCDKVQQGVTVTELVYIFPRKSSIHYQSIGTAWDEVWYATPPFEATDGVRLTMQLDYNSSADPLCTSTTTACFPRPTCRLTGFCSQNASGECLPACGRP